MGEPVKIVDLAKKMIKLSGADREAIKITEAGIRPGEKLYEELLSTSENTKEQVYEKIFVGKVTNEPIDLVLDFVKDTEQLNDDQLKKQLVDFANGKIVLEQIQINEESPLVYT